MSSTKLAPVLKADDFVIGPYRDYHGRYCLLGWREHIFRGVDLFDEMYKARMKIEPNPKDGISLTWTQRPNTLANRKLAVKVWNLFLKQLGYTDDGPITDLDKLVNQ